MLEPDIQVNVDFPPVITRIGREKTPVIVIDDFVANVDEFVSYACDQVSFETEKITMYPGVRAKLARKNVVQLLNPLLPLLYQTYSIPAGRRPKPKNYVYSLVATAGHDLSTLQRVPHVDSNLPHYLAMTHYLNPGKHGGTGLFRHRPTGFENITESRRREFGRSADAFIADNGQPASGYITASDGHFELLDVIDYRPNRVVIYPGSLLHSGMIDPVTDISADPRAGRLTANIFVNFE